MKYEDLLLQAKAEACYDLNQNLDNLIGSIVKNAYERGREVGIEETYDQAFKKGEKEGYSKGYKEGLRVGTREVAANLSYSFGGAVWRKYNHGATQETDMSMGSHARGHLYIFEETYSISCHRLPYKSELEYLFRSGTLDFLCNRSYAGWEYNHRAKVQISRNEYITFYHGWIEGCDKISTINDESVSTHSQDFCFIWLADSTSDPDKAMAAIIPVTRQLYSLFGIQYALVPKTYKMQAHFICRES